MIMVEKVDFPVNTQSISQDGCKQYINLGILYGYPIAQSLLLT